MGKVLIGNFKGKQGDQGIQGEEGKAASIMIDSVQTLQPEENATVENVGTTSDARLKFGIPRGADGMTDLVARYEDASEYTATPTSDAPIVINDLNGKTQQTQTNGYQLFDASKLPSKTQSGATVTNNGDGSFTISGSGNLSENFSNHCNYSIDEFKKLFKPGFLYLKGGINLGIYTEFAIISNAGNLFVKNNNYINITEDIYNNITDAYFVFYGKSGSSIPNETIKPMLFQDGDGTWEPFSGGMASPSPDWEQKVHGVGDMGYFDGILQKGYYNTNGVYTSADNYVCTVNKIECKQSDNINVELETSATSIIVSFFQSSGTFISQQTGSGTSLTAAAPANVGYCMISINRASIEPQTAGHICVKVNGKYASGVESHGVNLFDASKLPSNSGNGIDVTNNGDGSFTIGGQNTSSGDFIIYHTLSHEETIKLLKAGTVKINQELSKYPYYGITASYDSKGQGLFEINSVQSNKQSYEITQEMLDNPEFRIRYFIYMGSGFTISKRTIKPMLFQDGDGTWQPYRHTSIQFPLTSPLYDGDKVCYVKPGESYINSEGDTVIADRMLYGHYHENGREVFDGSEDERWSANKNLNGFYQFTTSSFISNRPSIGTINVQGNKDKAMCNIGIGIDPEVERISGAWIYDGNTVVVCIKSEMLSEYSVSAFMSWLSTHNVELVYKLAQPYFEPFEDQTPFYNLRSFDNLTYIYSDDSLNPILTVDVAKNQTGGYALEAYNHSLKNQNVYNDIDERINNMLFADYDGKVYSTFFEDSTTSMASTGEKEDDNAGIANPVPSTDTVSNENPYDSIPLFKPIECNGYVDEEGNPHITAIKGSPEFKEDGSNGDVCIALKTGYIRTIVDTDGSILGKKGRKVSVTDTWRESEYPNHPFVPYTGAIRLDDSVRPYILIPKYQAVNYNDSYYSLPGLCPVYNVSHNNQITTFQKRGKQYCGETNSDAEIWETLFEIVFATLNSQSIMAGCTNYNYQYQVAKAESSVKRVIVTNSQANNILVGSCVSIGDKGTNSSVDKGNSYMHSLANRVLVTKKESLSDGANTAIYVDSSNSFTTTATTYISTMPWYTGATNSVKGTCGSPVDNLNGKYPFKFLGIEFALGQYIVRSDVILNGVYDSGANTYRQDIYTCLDCTKFATAITSDYAKVGYSIPDTNVTWLYISELGFDSKNPHVRMATKYGANSSQRYADAVYTGTRANGTREFLSLGNLNGGSVAGLRLANLHDSLSTAYWSIAARPSYTGRRGTVADWASAMGVTLAA